MRTSTFFSKKLVLYFLFSALTVCGMQMWAQTCNTIVGGSYFEATNAEASVYRGITSTVKLGPSGGIMSTPLPFTSDYPDFGTTKKVHGVVDNPRTVNSAYTNVEDPMIILSGESGTNQTLLSYNMSGMKPGTTFTIEVEIYLVNSSVPSCVSQWFQPDLQLLLNPDQWGNTPTWQTDQANFPKTVTISNWGRKNTYKGTFTLPATLSGFNFEIRTGWQVGYCLAYGISKIEIKGCLLPKIKPNEGEEVCKGEQVRFSLDREYNATTYKWEKSPNGVIGWTPVGGNSKTILDEVDGTTYYRCTVDGSESELIKITTVNCCEVSPGVTSSRKTIYHDNFGIFSGPTSYKDAFKTSRTAINWQTCEMPYTIPNHTCTRPSPDDGHYVISTLRPGVMEEWMRGEMTQDASGDPNGGVLAINVNHNHDPLHGPYYGEIYRQRIDDLCQGIDLYFEVYIANASRMNNTPPPNVTISILKTDGVSVLGTVNSTLTASTTGWQRVTILPFSTTETSVILRIVSNNTCCWDNGVDLLMDEVIFRVCSPPLVDIYSDLSSLTQDETICDNESVTLASTISQLLINYYGGNPRYLYQESMDGENWKNISGKLTSPSYTQPLISYSGKKVYFRIIAGTDVILDKFVLDPNAEESTQCKTASISDPIEINVVYCPPCMIPDNLGIQVTSGHPVNAKTVNLCQESDPLSLKTTDLKLSGTVNATQFDITWYKDVTTGTPVSGPTQASSTSVTGITWNSVGSGNTAKYIVRVTDHDKLPTENMCPVYDTIYVKALEKPEVPSNTMIGNFCQYDAPPALPSSFPGFDSYQWYDESMTPVTSISSAVAAVAKIHKYYVTVTKNGCVSDPLPVNAEVIAKPGTLPATTIRYYRSDIQPDNKFQDLMTHDPTLQSLKDPGMVLLWLQPDGVTWSETVPVPPTPDPDSTKDEAYTYQVKQKRVLTPPCEGEPVTVTVQIYSTPLPKVAPLSYCLGETPEPLTAEIVPSPTYTKDDYQLRWYENETTSVYTTEAPLVSTASADVTTYYVSQYNTKTFAESKCNDFTVTVYAKPDLTIHDPAPVCAPDAVNIAQKDNVWSIANEIAISPAISGEYFKDQGASEVLSNPEALEEVGVNTYYIRAGFTKQNAAGADKCYSDAEPVIVNIQDLSVTISGSPTACQYTDVDLTAMPATNNNSGAITYNWSGNGKNESNKDFNTGELTNPKEMPPYEINLTIKQGACTAQASHEITIGDGPIVGIMTVSEPGSTTNPTLTFNPNDAKNFYSCGGDVKLEVDYANTDNDNFVWTNSTGAQVGVGKNITVTQPSGSQAYKVTFMNKCQTSTIVTINALPLKVDPLDSKMSLCQDIEEFKAELKITVADSENPVTNWYKDGNPVSTSQGKSPVYRIEKAQPEDSGIYTYTVTNKGCEERGTISDGAGKINLDVSAKVTFDPIPKEAVCEGDNPKLIGFNNIYPPSTTLSWVYDATITGPTDQKTITVRPEYEESNGSNHRSTYKYTIIATNVYCTRDTTIGIDVDEPLRGAIAAKTPICEGSSTTLDASSYHNAQYVWSSPSFPGNKWGAAITESPVFTTNYDLDITRGECQAQDNITIVVNSRPVILDIDSVGVRDREIIFAPGYGSHPLEYVVDNEPADGYAIKYGLLFGWHNFYIIDAAGCKSNVVPHNLEAPKLYPPIFFSPNGDGFRDTWEVEGMREIYPDAVVSIYDRYGKELIIYKGQDEGWDGQYKGLDMPTTDYWYIIEIKEVNAQYVGHFTLIRR